MSDFDLAIPLVLDHEGGLVDDSADPGGATNHGVSLRYLRDLGDADGDGELEGDLDHDGDVDAEDILRLSRDEAIEVYRVQWWERYGYGRIEAQQIAAKVLDLAVNMGPLPAHRLLQQALIAAERPVKVDGILGPVTLAAVNRSRRFFPLLAALRSEAAGHYRLLVARRPELAVFERGWLRRAYA